MNYTIDQYEFNIDEKEIKNKKDDDINKYIYEKRQEMKIAQKFMNSFISNYSDLVIFFMDENENKNYLEKIIKNYELEEQIYIIHYITDNRMEKSLMKQFEKFSSATHTNFPSGNKAKKAEKYYIEEILSNKCENKNKQIIHYIYYEYEKDRNEDLFNTINAKFKTANSNTVNFIDILKNHLVLYLNQISKNPIKKNDIEIKND